MCSCALRYSILAQTTTNDEMVGHASTAVTVAFRVSRSRYGVVWWYGVTTSITAPQDVTSPLQTWHIPPVWPGPGPAAGMPQRNLAITVNDTLVDPSHHLASHCSSRSPDATTSYQQWRDHQKPANMSNGHGSLSRHHQAAIPPVKAPH